MKPSKVRIRRRRAALTFVVLVVVAGCDRLQQQGPLPTYPDTKLEAMRAVTGASLPHDPHGAASAAVVAPPASGAARR